MQRERIIITLVTVVVASFVGINSIFVPFNNKIQKLRVDIVSEERKNKALVDILDVQKKIMPIINRFSREMAPGEVIDKIVQFATKSDVALTFIEPRASASSNYFTITSIHLKVNAPYHKLGGFIAQIENMADNLRIENLTVSSMEKMEHPEHYAETGSGSDEMGKGRVFASVTLSTYSINKIF